MLAALRPHPSLWQLIATGCRRHAFSISGSLSHRRTYILLHTTYNPSLDCPTLPQLVTSLAKPPKSIVLLATSRYATFLANDIGVLESHIATLFNPMSTMSSASLSPSDKPGIEVLAGVVDALPVLSTQEGNGIKARRQEGYTWLITDKAGIITTPWKENKSKDIDEFGAPIMRVSGRRTNWGNERPIPFIFTFPIRSAESVGACRAVVTLPLSNTLFQTGTLATVVRFNVGGWGDRLSPQPVLAENRLYRVEVPVMSLEGGRARSGRRLPLLPLTEPREVIACAGNILRGLKISEGGTTPASRELEVAVGRYFRDRGRRQEKVDVFAYITPQKPSGENGGEVDPWDTQKGKLRRVLGGGGGWGQKAGLLSLDPQGWTYALGDVAYGKLHYDDNGIGDDLDGNGGEFKQRFEERFFGGKDDVVDVRGVEEQRGKRVEGRHPEAVVEVGDWVRFYIVEGQRAGEAGDDAGGGKVVFGCVSKEGEIVGHEEESWEAKKTAERTFGQVDVEGLFGGRSEEGVWIHYERDGEQVENGDVRGRRGKMDVPGGELEVVVGK